MTQGFVLFTFWKVNTKQLTKDFCINKNRPELNCNASCYLTKKLEQQEGASCCNKDSKTKKVPEKTKRMNETNFICSFKSFQFDEAILLKTEVNSYSYQLIYNFDYQRIILEPPQA